MLNDVFSFGIIILSKEYTKIVYNIAIYNFIMIKEIWCPNLHVKHLIYDKWGDFENEQNICMHGKDLNITLVKLIKNNNSTNGLMSQCITPELGPKLPCHRLVPE